MESIAFEGSGTVPEPRRVTVRDVAAAAGVSLATASRALSGGPRVNPETRRRVLRASEELGWSANALARALRTRHTGTIGVVVPSVNNPYFAMLLEGLESQLAASDRSLIVCNAGGSSAKEAERIDVLLSRMVDGLVIVACGGAESLPALHRAARQVPTVLLDRSVEDSGLDYVGTDNVEGMRLVLAHLERAGVRSVAFVGGDLRASTGRERLRGFRRHAERFEFEVLGEHSGDFSFAWGAEAARRLLAEPRLPDAIVCSADIVAAGVLMVLHQADVAVPGQVRVTGFDNIEMDEITYPPLTSVRQAMESQTREALRLLDARAEDRDRSGSRIVLAPELVFRESSPAV